MAGAHTFRSRESSARPAPTTSRRHASPELDAVLFDMDGVITDTAKVHAVAWQRLFDDFLSARAATSSDQVRPFDVQRDYRQYVDGKPRYDGVASFLESRGIALPRGNPDDGPELETICGLGNRKDRYFTAWLDSNRVETYPGTLRLVDDLHRAGIKTAVFTSSRNAVTVLTNAGVLGLFDAKVDGTDLAQLDLPGKPDPAMLWEAAARLGAAPARAAIVEDSVAGVQAGVSGKFGFVIGVDRGDGDDGLLGSGADVVVSDLSEVALVDDARLAVEAPDTPGSPGESAETI
jgi:beta-phosphoglucomutase family hydrolase